MSDKCNCPTCTQARQQAARECAEIVGKVASHMRVLPQDDETAAEHFLIVARDAILRKFGVEP